MQPGDRIAARVFVSFLIVLFLEPLLTLGRQCELSATYGSTHYNYSLAAPSQKYPHGVMSEDGRRKVCALRLFGWCCAFLGDAKDWTHFSVRIWFYKVAVNETILWYQLCDQMIFNHGQPRCLNCQDCGGPSRCGMQCSALTANVIGGYHVCTTIGQGSNLNVSLIEKNNPQKGVIVMMVANNLKENCSLSVSVICDSNKVQVSNSLTISGECDYATELWHPSGCPRIISAKAKGWEWFGTLIIILLCFLGAYLLVGTSYRCFFLGIHGIQAIPNLQFWFNLSQRIRVVLVSLARTLKGFFCGRRASYTPL